MTLLAQSVVDIPLNDTVKTILGLLGVMSLGIGVMWFAVLWKKLFGRKPPLAAELEKLEARLRAEIVESHARVFRNSEEARHEVTVLRGEVTDGFRDQRAEFDGKITRLDDKVSKVAGEVIANLANALTVASQTTNKS